MINAKCKTIAPPVSPFRFTALPRRLYSIMRPKLNYITSHLLEIGTAPLLPLLFLLNIVALILGQLSKPRTILKIRTWTSHPLEKGMTRPSSPLLLAIPIHVVPRQLRGVHSSPPYPARGGLLNRGAVDRLTWGLEQPTWPTQLMQLYQYR